VNVQSIRATWRGSWDRNRGLTMALVVFAALLSIVVALGGGSLSYFDVSFLASGGATLAIAAMGATLVILTGGFDLSVGAVISLVNVTLAILFAGQSADVSVATLTLIGVAVGMAAGAVNGFFVAVLRLQSIVVTLSTMFIVQGVTLLVMETPGGAVPPQLADVYMGDAIASWLPMSVLLLVVLALVWGWLKRTPYGVALIAVGSDADATQAAGVRVMWVRFAAYVLAGGMYGMAGVFLSAQTGAGDPLVGNPMLLSVFAAVVVGGTRLGGGRGGLVGSILGAYILAIMVNILLVLNVSAYVSTIAEGVILVLAALAVGFGRDSVLVQQVRALLRRWHGWRGGSLPRQHDAQDRRMPAPGAPPAVQLPGWHVRHAQTLRTSLPTVIGLMLMLLATQFWLGQSMTHWSYWNVLIVLSSFLAILALGQGAVILTGGLDLSLPWNICLCGILFASWTQGVDAALPGALLATLLVGCLIGLCNGLGVVVLGLSPIVVTLASNGILQGMALLISGGTPTGFAPPVLRWFMTGQIGGVTPVVLFVVLFATAAVLLLSHTAFGRRVMAVGNSQVAARLAGVRVGGVLISVYALSGVCAALVGVLLTGFSGQASLGMGDEYLLPTIALVVVGGGLITGGRGHYLGMLAGVLLLTALQTLLTGSNLPYALRAILYGLVLLGAVIALREKRGN